MEGGPPQEEKTDKTFEHGMAAGVLILAVCVGLPALIIASGEGWTSPSFSRDLVGSAAWGLASVQTFRAFSSAAAKEPTVREIDLLLLEALALGLGALGGAFLALSDDASDWRLPTHAVIALMVVPIAAAIGGAIRGDRRGKRKPEGGRSVRWD